MTGASSSEVGGTSTVLDYEAAFSLRTFAYEDAPALSPDGKWVAYSIYTQPPQLPWRDLPTEPLYLPNGMPSKMVGNQLYLTHVATGQTRQIGPTNHNSWRPSWSPSSKEVAFFSDAGGSPQLWVYDCLQHKAWKVSEASLK